MKRSSMVAILLIVSSACIMLGFAGCAASADTKDLSRAAALSLLGKSDKIKPIANVMVTQEAFEAAKRDGILNAQLQLSPAAAVYFTQYWYFAKQATLKAPLKLKIVEVTGITDAPPQFGGKLIDFNWQFQDAPDLVIKYTGTVGTLQKGEAFVKLYDDGWRVEEIQFHD